jgi:hypothetical protein
MGRSILEGEVKRRLKFGLVALLALVAIGACTAVAGAATASKGLPAGALNSPREGEQMPQTGNGFDPEFTNIPYLAWRGEQLRFVKCDDEFNSEQSVDWIVADWSGNPDLQPRLIPGSVNFFVNNNDEACWSARFFSDKPGLARIKLFANDAIVHEFLAGWMGIGSVTLSNLSGTGSTVNERPGNDISNDVGIIANGVIPLDNEWQQDSRDETGTQWVTAANLTGGGVCPTSVDITSTPGALCATLPNDWATLAHAYAAISADQRATNPSVLPWQYWDIHDSSAPAALGVTDTLDTHVAGFCAPKTASTTTDQVDNCQGGGEFDAFSRVFGDNTDPTIGPFDPEYPDQTLLSDGLLNAADAPMPPLRINLTSTGNTGAFDTSSPNSVDKHVIYSRNGTGAASTAFPNNAHNLYAPFYGEYIPASSRSYDAAGTWAPVDETGGNNFEGYLVYGQYHFWDVADVLVNADSVASTGCFLGNGDPRFTNSGAQSVAVYTDEHGEARAEWIPGLNNDIFGTLPLDEDLGCDLEGVNLGGAVIGATAQYPNENAAGPVRATGSVTKVISNLFHKGITCQLKNNRNGVTTPPTPPATGLAGQVYICTIVAQDINGGGASMNGETVCVSREPFGTMYGNYVYGDLTHGIFGEPGEICVPLGATPANRGLDPGEEDQNGDVSVNGRPAMAQVETPATINGTPLDISAYFQNERIWRDTCFIVGSLASGVSSSPGACGSGQPAGQPAVEQPPAAVQSPEVTKVTPVVVTTTVANSTGGAPASQTNQSKTTIKAAVVSVKVVATRAGRALVVKVQSPKKLATIRIVMVGKNGRVVARLTRSVATNKAVRVSHVLVPRSVKAVHVKLVS